MPNTKQKFIQFREWFDPYNPEHVKAAAKYLHNYDWPEGSVPEDVVLTYHYEIQSIIKDRMTSAWILFITEGLKKAPITH
jgi:hypothetical protein